MKSPALPSTARKLGISSGNLIGGGIGTMATAVVTTIPKDYWFTPWVQVLAPPVALALAALGDWAIRCLERWHRRRSSRKFYESSRATLNEAMINPHTSQEHKASLQEDFEVIEKVYTRSIRGEMVSLNASIAVTQPSTADS